MAKALNFSATNTQPSDIRNDELLRRRRSRALGASADGLGLTLQIGFLHSDKHGRNSLVWDCIEPLRARINANVFKFIGSREFARADFPASGVKTHRIARPIIAELLSIACCRTGTFSTRRRGCGIWLWRRRKHRAIA